jgi:hypothetical protein
MAKFPVCEEGKKNHLHIATVWHFILFFLLFLFENHTTYGKNLRHVNYELRFAVQLLYKDSLL